MAQPSTDKSGKIVKAEDGRDAIEKLFVRLEPAIAAAVPKVITPERMARIAMTALRTNDKLARCTPLSLMGAILSAAQLGLEPNTPMGQAYLIPYKGEATLQIGYQGMIDLMRRSGSVVAVYAYCVYDCDKFSFELGLRPNVVHVPSDDANRESHRVTHVYAVARLKDAEPVFVVMSRAQVEARRKRSHAGGSGPWVTDWEAMARKTAVRELYKWCPRSTEMAAAATVDEAAEYGQSQRSGWDPQVQESVQKIASELPAHELEAHGEEVDDDPEGSLSEHLDPEQDGR